MKKIISIILLFCLIIPTCFASTNVKKESSIEKDASKLTSFQKDIKEFIEYINSLDDDSSIYGLKFTYYKTDNCVSPQRKMINITYIPSVANEDTIIFSIEDNGIAYKYKTNNLSITLATAKTIAEEWNKENENDYCDIKYCDMSYVKNGNAIIVADPTSDKNYERVTSLGLSSGFFVFCSFDNFIEVVLKYSNKGYTRIEEECNKLF